MSQPLCPLAPQVSVSQHKLPLFPTPACSLSSSLFPVASVWKLKQTEKYCYFLQRKQKELNLKRKVIEVICLVGSTHLAIAGLKKA